MFNIFTNNKKEIWLALWWWATKWFVHLGVIKYLEENNYTITEVAWTSMGSIIGTLVCSGMSFDDMYQAFKQIKTSDLIDIDLTQWLIKWDNIINILKETCGDIAFADLSIPLKVIAVNIDTGKEKAFSTWSVIEAVHCSIAIPGIFSVQKHSQDNAYYLDGWLINNLPISHLSSKHIVAVSCSWKFSKYEEESTTIFGKTFNTNFFSIPKNVLYRSLDIMMLHNENMQLASHANTTLIRPNLTHISSYDISVLDEAIMIWYEEAKKILW